MVLRDVSHADAVQRRYTRRLFPQRRFHKLEDSLRFYVQRDTDPQKWYPHPDGGQPFDDLPVRYQSNIDRHNAPLTNRKGGQPVWTEAEIHDVAAFLSTLNDSDARSVASTGAGEIRR